MGTARSQGLSAEQWAVFFRLSAVPGERRCEASVERRPEGYADHGIIHQRFGTRSRPPRCGSFEGALDRMDSPRLRRRSLAYRRIRYLLLRTERRRYGESDEPPSRAVSRG